VAVQPTYDENLGSTRDWVRLLIGDRGPTTFVFSDAELDAFVTEANDNKYVAAAEALESLLMSWVGGGKGVKNKSVEGLSVTYAGPEDMRKRIDTLRKKAAASVTTQPVFRVLV
jgi:hypothetical protein